MEGMEEVWAWGVEIVGSCLLGEWKWRWSVLREVKKGREEGNILER